MSDQYKLRKNEKFGFLQIAPTPSPATISEFYSKEFYSGDYKRFNDSSLEVQLENKELLSAQWGRVEKTISKDNELDGKSIIDIGCGWGQALLYFRDHGYNCYGFDPAPEAVAYGKDRGLNLKCAGLETLTVFGDKKFDVVMMNNVLEHLSDPEQTMSEIRSSLINEDGFLIVDVPNEFNDFQVAGQKIHGLDEWWVAPPGHLNYFSLETLSNLMRGTGFSVLNFFASFPMEMFLLFNDNYVGDQKIGSACHNKRVAFELNLIECGFGDKLDAFYHNIAKLGIGRQIVMIAKPCN